MPHNRFWPVSLRNIGGIILPCKRIAGEEQGQHWLKALSRPQPRSIPINPAARVRFPPQHHQFRGRMVAQRGSPSASQVPPQVPQVLPREPSSPKGTSLKGTFEPHLKPLRRSP